MAIVIAALVLLSGWCPAVSDLGGDVVRLFLEQPVVKFERDDFGRWQIRDNADAVYYLDGDRVMMRYQCPQVRPTITSWEYVYQFYTTEIRGPRAERIRMMLEDRR